MYDITCLVLTFYVDVDPQRKVTRQVGAPLDASLEEVAEAEEVTPDARRQREVLLWAVVNRHEYVVKDMWITPL